MALRWSEGVAVTESVDFKESVEGAFAVCVHTRAERQLSLFLHDC